MHLLDLLVTAPEQAATALRELAMREPVPSTWSLLVNILGNPELAAELAPLLRQQLTGLSVPNDVEAASLLYAAYESAGGFEQEQAVLRDYLQNTCFDPATGWFYDKGVVGPLTLAGMWPFVVGAATDDQGWAVRTTLLKHPWTDERVFWAAGGCIRLGHPEAARTLLQTALERGGPELPRQALLRLWEECEEYDGES